MSFNLKDPAGIQALLDELRSSSAWQELSTAPAQAPEPVQLATTEAQGKQPPTSSASGTPLSVASLLSQLQAPRAPQLHRAVEPPSLSQLQSSQATPQIHRAVELPSLESNTSSQKAVEKTPHNEVRSFTFDESMPVLLQLSRESAFVDDIKKIKQEQNTLERQLWEERRSIYNKYEEKIKAACIKANMIGITFSKHEAETLANAHKKELAKFDRDRALSAWDGLVSRQQAKLQSLNVPTMYVTTDKPTRELQQRILQVLVSIVGLS